MIRYQVPREETSINLTNSLVDGSITYKSQQGSEIHYLLQKQEMGDGIVIFFILVIFEFFLWIPCEGLFIFGQLCSYNTIK